MGLSIDDIAAKFPVKMFPTIEEEPDHALISSLMQGLYSNAASLVTPLGGGLHGHIGLLVPVSLYSTLTPTPYQPPQDPGPLIDNVGTAAARESTKAQHSELKRIYDNHHSMDDALKAQIIDTINNTYLCELRNKYTSYLGITTRDMLDHLLDQYGKITPTDIKSCKQRMNAPMDTSLPIDVYFQCIDNCVQYAVDGKVAYTADQILQTGYHGISTSGLYNDSCKDWRKKPTKTKTWNNFKHFFAAEYHNLKEQLRVNNTQTNFHGANAAVDITTALDNLAMAAALDRSTVE